VTQRGAILKMQASRTLSIKTLSAAVLK